MSEPVRVDLARLRYFIASAFEAVGMPAADARIVGTLMAEADLQGSDGHGVIRLAGMCVCSGKNSDSNPRSSHARASSVTGIA